MIREVFLLKRFDPDSNIPSIKGGPGIAFYTKNLNIQVPQGCYNRLETFYQKECWFW